jgi:hypothetical protein
MSGREAHWCCRSLLNHFRPVQPQIKASEGSGCARLAPLERRDYTAMATQ